MLSHSQSFLVGSHGGRILSVVTTVKSRGSRVPSNVLNSGLHSVQPSAFIYRMACHLHSGLVYPLQPYLENQRTVPEVSLIQTVPHQLVFQEIPDPVGLTAKIDHYIQGPQSVLTVTTWKIYSSLHYIHVQNSQNQVEAGLPCPFLKASLLQSQSFAMTGTTVACRVMSQQRSYFLQQSRVLSWVPSRHGVN